MNFENLIFMKIFHAGLRVFNVFFVYLQLLENMESKMKNTCVDGTIPKLFEGKMLVSSVITVFVPS